MMPAKAKEGISPKGGLCPTVGRILTTANPPPLAKIEEPNKIITLVCYLLEYLGALTESQLFEIIMVDDLVPQIMLTDALSIIEERALADLNESRAYSINDSGKTWLKGYENSLLITHRRKILQDGKDLLRLEELRKYATWSIEQVGNQWAFEAQLLNEFDDSAAMKITQYYLTEEDAELARKRFLKDPAKAIAERVGELL